VIAAVMEWWITAKYQIPSTKLQTNLKFQYSMTKTGLEFRILVPPAADYLFDICNL
jgi:hypothetical protein